MTTILVTGGCGFIGSNFVRYVLRGAARRQGGQFRLPDLCRQPRQSGRPGKANPRYRFLKGDITDRERRRKPRSTGVESVDPFRRREPRGSQHPRLRAVRPHQCPRHAGAARRGPRPAKVRRFVHVSTDEVYGSLGPTGVFTEETPLAAEQPLRRQQGGRGPAGAQLRPHLRHCRRSSRAARTTTAPISSRKSSSRCSSAT